MEPPCARIGELVVRHRLVSPGDRVLAAVSGGPDSACLAHVLTTLGGQLGFTLRIAHFDHRLRGEASREDAEWVRNFALSLGLEFHLGTADISSLAMRSGRSVETEARLQRYRFLAETARSTRSPVIAVGHTMDDQAETILMHLLRGTGLAGLRGMLYTSTLSTELGGDGTTRVIRPLLTCSRSETNAYCRSHGIEPREDLSNHDRSIARNRIRHELIPILKDYQPQIVEVLSRTGSVLASEDEIVEAAERASWRSTLVESSVPGRLAFDLARWRSESLPIQRRLVRRAYRALSGTLENLSWEHVEQVAVIAQSGSVGATITLPRHIEAVIGYGRLEFSDPRGRQHTEEAIQIDATIPLAASGTTPLSDGWSVVVEHIDGDVARAALSITQRESSLLAFFDAERVGPDLQLRVRKPGDRFRPLGMEQGSVQVKELMINERIPQALRRGWPILATPERILWIPGLRLAADVAVTADTRSAVRVQLIHSSENSSA